LLIQSEWEKMNDIITSIHSIKNTTAMRRVFLEKLMTVVDFNFADFNIGLLKKGGKPFLVDPVIVSKFGRSFEKDFEHQYESIYAPMDYVNWVFLSPESLVYRESDLINEEIRKKSNFYLKYLKVFDLIHIAGVVIATEGRFLGAVTLYRCEKKGDFSEKDLYVLRQLMPHLQLRFDVDSTNVKKNEKSVSYLLKNQYFLTNREIEVMGFLYYGHNNSEIADKLGIAPNTIKKHVYNIFEKIGVNSRTHLLKFLRDNELSDLWES